MTLTQTFHLKSWITYNTLGWIVGTLLIVVLGILGGLIGVGEKGGQCIIGIGVGAGVGYLQFRYFKKYFGFNTAWFWSSFLSFSLIYILYDVLSNFIHLNPETSLLFFTFISAFISALIQNRLILNKRVENFKLWPVVNAFTWFLVHLLTGALFMLNLKKQVFLPTPLIIVLAFTFLFIGGPILGLLSGLYFKARFKSQL